MKLHICNVYIRRESHKEYIQLADYKLYPEKIHRGNRNSDKRHRKNAYVEFNGRQEDSIIYKGGFSGEVGFFDVDKKLKKRKLIEDILLLGSILNGWNWELYSRRNYRNFPVTPYIRGITNILASTAFPIEETLNQAIEKIRDPQWQKQFENGFHLIMLRNHASIINNESRFLSNIVIWEWLYPHLKNPGGATPNDESDRLKLILTYVLNHFWPRKCFIGKNIFHILRNQLAHSGKLPIDRKYAKPWMQKLNWESGRYSRGIKEYIDFFDNLTQIVVLKTLGIDAEDIICPQLVDVFLRTGKLS